MKLPHSLQGRLLVLVLGLVVVVWVGTVAATWSDVRHELDELLDSHLAQAAALLVVQQAGEIEDDDRGTPDAPTLHRYAPKVAFQVFHEGRLALRSSNAPATPLLDLQGDAPAGFRTIESGGTRWRIFATRGPERDVRVFVGEQVASRDEILWAVLRGVVAPMLVALPLLALAAWWAIRRGVAPLRVLGRSLEQRRPQALEPVALSDAPAEMRPMLDALNGLLGRIAALMAGERRFTADAAHELRTPIAGIRAQAQVALGATQDAERRHALQATLQGCDRATRLVDQLLTLSRLDAGEAPLLVSTELGALVRQAVAELAPQAMARQQVLEVEAGDPHPVQGAPTLLVALLRNLVDNASRYGPAGAVIRVTVSDAPGTVVLAVEDSGPGMAPDTLQRLGERFFRVVGSGQEGSGLGWSIVRRIAAAHGAAVQVGRSKLLGGLEVVLRFPQAGATSQPAVKASSNTE